MKQFGLISLIPIAATLTLNAGHVPEKVMHHYCTEVAAAQYNVSLREIDAQMPVYKKKGFVVRGKIRHHNGYNDHFVCRYDAYGKFDFIKRQTTKPHNGLKKRMKRICKTEASVRWHTPVQEIRITDMRKINRYRYRVTMEDAYNTGTCEVNRDGYVSRFQTLNKRRHVPHVVKNACRQKAASRWNIPLPYVEVNEANYMGKGRYLVEVSSDDYTAQCEARFNGIIEHFSTKRRSYRW